MERYCELREKDVVNIFDGRRIGFVSDLNIDTCNGTILALIVPTCGKMFNWFRGSEEVIIPWNKVIKIGNDVILVEIDAATDYQSPERCCR